MLSELLSYIIKVNVGLVLFYGLYHLLFPRDTFFQLKRFLLLGVLGISFLYPFIQFSLKWGQPASVAKSIQTFILPEVVITPQLQQATPLFDWIDILWVIYVLGVVVFFFLFLIQFFQIFRIIAKSKKEAHHGMEVFVSKEIEAPFSFFQWILIKENLGNEKELNEILLHEQTHVNQWHSMDILFCELACFFCWFNPFVWLLKKDVRMNLEYLADRFVLSSGCETEHYQFHLLRLSNHKTAVKLINNFNVSPLKKRIMMMNAKKTSWIGLTKYVLVFPVVMALVLSNSIQAHSLVNEQQISQKEKSEENEVIVVQGYQLATKKSTTAKPVIQNKTTNTEENEVIVVRGYQLATKESTTTKPIIQNKTTNADDFVEVYQKPMYPGGAQALMEYLRKNVAYPASSAAANTQGRVVVKFIIDSIGKVTDPQVISSVDEACDKEALRAISAMPNWIPEKKDGKPVATYFTLPVVFRLNTANSNPVKPTVYTAVEIDGKEATQSEFNNLSPKDINSIEIKDDVKDANGTTGKRVIVTTKQK